VSAPNCPAVRESRLSRRCPLVDTAYRAGILVQTVNPVEAIVSYTPAATQAAHNSKMAKVERNL
jgi:hypothetical protein